MSWTQKVRPLLQLINCLVPKIHVSMIHVPGKFTLSLAYSADGKYLASGAIDGIIAVFDMEQRKLLHTLEVNKSKLIYVEIKSSYLFKKYIWEIIL